MTPTVLERNSYPDTLPGDKPVAPLLDRRAAKGSRGKHKAVRLVFHNGGNQFWGIEETNWADAPLLADRSFRHSVGGREMDFYYNGSHLHMIVLQVARRVVLGGEHAARRPVERDDDRDREGPQTSNKRQVRFRTAWRR